MNERSVDGTTALHWAVYQGDLDLVKTLLERGADVTLRNAYGVTAMATAAVEGDLKIIEALLAAGADVESPNAEGQTALMVVARTGRVDTAKLLLDKGSEIDEKYPPLHNASGLLQLRRGNVSQALSAFERAVALNPKFIEARMNVGNTVLGFRKYDTAEQHFSPLEEINAETVSQLSLAWSLDLDTGNSVTQPIAVDGKLYFVTGSGILHAVDAVTGTRLWSYDAKVWEHETDKMRMAWGSRGAAWWNGMVYFGTMDGRVDLVLDGGSCHGEGATTVDITEPYWRMIKEGAVPERDIADCLHGS